MIILSWNCQGLENPLIVHHFKGITKAHSSELVILSETKHKHQHIASFLTNVHYIKHFSVDATRLSGWLAIEWKERTEVEIKGHSTFFTHCKVRTSYVDSVWDIIGVYLSYDNEQGED